MGESIAIDGACLTVVERAADRFRTQASAGTLGRTTLGALRPGDRVNLERALRLSDRGAVIWCSGHVDAVSSVRSIAPEGGAQIVTFEVPASLAPLFIEKGSVAVDGVSPRQRLEARTDAQRSEVVEHRARPDRGFRGKSVMQV